MKRSILWFLISWTEQLEQEKCGTSSAFTSTVLLAQLEYVLFQLIPSFRDHFSFELQFFLVVQVSLHCEDEKHWSFAEIVQGFKQANSNHAGTTVD